MDVKHVVEKVKGARIVDTIPKYCIDIKVYDDNIECDEGDIYIVLDNGLVIKVWNSEWGGIEIKEKEWIEDDSRL